MEIGITIDKNGTINPANINDRKWLVSKLKQNKEYKCKITNSRNIKHLGLYWILMKALEFHFGNTDEAWHQYFKTKFLPLTEFKIKGEKRLYPSSVAFENMSQIEFDDYYGKIENHLIECGYNIEELIDTM